MDWRIKMINASKNTFAPEERYETIRRYIMALLEEYTLSKGNCPLS